MSEKEILLLDLKVEGNDEINKTSEDFDNLKTTLQLEFKPTIKIICGSAFNVNSFVCFITEIGEVYFKGELEKYNYKEFTKIENISNIEFAGCGEDFILLIDNKNNFFGCGVDYGQSGLHKYNSIDFHNSNCREILEFKKFNVDFKDKIKFIHCSSEIVIIVTMDNKILFVGNSEVLNGKKEHIYEFKYFENNLPEIKDLQCGFYHSIILDYNGNIYGSGSNKKGQLGFEDFTITLKTFQQLNVDFKVKKIRITPNGTVLLNYFNEIYVCGNDNLDFFSQPIGFKKINLNLQFNIHSIKLSYSGYHLSFILVNKNKLYFLQYNESSKTTITEVNAKFSRNWKYYYFEEQGEEDNIVSLFAIGSDYKINKRIYNNTNIKIFKQKLFLQTLVNDDNRFNPFIDIVIVNEEINEIKKRDMIVDNGLDKKKKRKL